MPELPLPSLGGTVRQLGSNQGYSSGQIYSNAIYTAYRENNRLPSWRIGSMPAAHDNRPAAGNIEGSRPAGTHPADNLLVAGQDSLPDILPTRTAVLSAAWMLAGHSDAGQQEVQTF